MEIHHIGEEAIFQVARQIETAELRETYLEQVCRGDVELRRRVEQLLAVHEEDQDYLTSPAACVELSAAQASTKVDEGGQIGPYTIRQQVGEGGMGIVYVAEQSQPVRRKVALKVIKPGMATKSVVARFGAERQALALMDHPNVATVHDGGVTEDGRPYFVMELVEGLPITDYCDRQRMDIRQRLQLFCKVCEAVEHAHRKGIIHRDLKPSNVLVPEIDGRPVPKVIDFGISKALGEKLSDATIYTHLSQLVGTPAYMSPEQAGMGVVDVDTRSDVYSLGVLLYELLTGTTPFDRTTLQQAGYDEMRRIIREEHPRRPSTRISTLEGKRISTAAEQYGLDPRKLADMLRGELDWVAMKALEKNRDRRYESCSSLADDLERFLNDEPVVARPPSVTYRIRKFARRNRALAVSIATVCLAVCLIMALVTTGFIKERRQAREKQKLIELLTDLVGTPYGTETHAKTSTLLESLDRLEGELSERFDDSPAMEIEARRIFGQAYLRYEEHEKADRHLQRALTLAERRYGPNDKEVADILLLLAGDIEWHAKRHRDLRRSQEYAERAYAIYDRLGIVEETDILFTLGFALSLNIDRSKEAEGYLRRNLAKMQRLASEADSSATVFALSDLASHLARTQEDSGDEVDQLMNTAVAMSERVDSDNPTRRASVISTRGRCFFLQGKYDQAIKCFQKCWDIHKQHGFETEDRAIQAQFWVAELNLVENRHGEGRKVHDQIKAFAEEHEKWGYLADVYHGRAFGDLLRDDHDAAEDNLRKAIEIAANHQVEYAGLNAMARIKLVCLLEAQGDEAKRQEAKSICKEVAHFLQPQFIDMNEWTPEFYYLKARSLLCLGELDEADKVAKKGLKWAGKGPAHRRQPHLHLIRALILNRRGHRESAIQLLTRTLAATPFSTSFGISFTGPKTRKELETTLAQWLAEAGKFDEACKVYTKGIRGRGAQLTDNPTDAELLPVTLAKLRYGMFLHDQQKWELAEPQLRRAFDQLRKNPEAAIATVQRAGQELKKLQQNSNSGR